MSARFVAHVHRPDLPVEDIDCDAAHVNELGYLALTVNAYVGAIACYAPGTWESYRLEATPEQLARQAITLNQWRARQGMPPIIDGAIPVQCSDDAKQEHRPEVGDRLHIYSDAQGCLPGAVTDTAVLTVVLQLDGYDRGCGLYQSVIHDETRTADGSWHWPHDSQQPAETEPEPDAAVPVTVNITVEGSVLAERDLRRIIDRQLLRDRLAGVNPHHFRR